MLVNSAADWGRSDPLLTRAHRPRRCSAAGFSDDDVDRVLWRNPVEFYGQSGRLDLDDVDAGRHVRGQLDPARGALMRLRHPTARPCTWPTAPTCTRPRTSPGIVAQLDTYAVADPRATSDADVLGLGLWLAAPVAAGLAADPAAAPAAARASSTRAGWRW